MANTVASTNMNMPVPVVGVDPGPQWALDVNSCLTILDSHNHSPGNGVQISPSGMNISSDLSFLNNNATTLRSIRMTSQSGVLVLATDLDCAYVVSGDLYFNDGLGNNVRITQGGNVAGTPGSIANLTSPASASYVALDATFVWQSAANTPANMDAASYIYRNLIANSKGLTLQPPTAMGADYTLTLPSLPASQKIMTLDNSGIMSAPYSVDNSSLEISTNVIQIKNSGVTTIKIADLNVTRPKLVAVGQQVSSSSGTFVTSSGNYDPVTNLTCTITTTGRPVVVKVIPDGSSETPYYLLSANTFTASAVARIKRDSTVIAHFPRSISSSATGNLSSAEPTTIVNTMDVPASGTYTYTVEIKLISGTGVNFNDSKLFVYEL